MKQSFKYIAVLVLVLAFANVTSLQQYVDAEGEGAEAPTTLQSCGFPGQTEALMSYATEDAVWPELQDAPFALADPIPAGAYRIVAHSYDDHTGKNNPTQLDERWQFWAYGLNQSDPVFYSNYTNDLPDDIDRNQTLLHDYVYFAEPVSAFRYVHWAYSHGLEDLQFGKARFDDLTAEQKKYVTWQSVVPDCIEFEPVSMVTCTALTAVAVTGKNGVYDFSATVENAGSLPLQTQFVFGDGTAAITVEGLSVQHSYAKGGTYNITANIILDGALIGGCQTSVSFTSSSGGAVLGATTTTPNGTTLNSNGQVLGTSTTRTSGGSNSGGAVLGASTYNGAGK